MTSGSDVATRVSGADAVTLVQEAGFDHVKALYVDNFDGLTGTQPILHRNVPRFQERLVFKAHIRLYHSTLGLRVRRQEESGTLCASSRRV